jgi:DNA-binding response OmpR family regulator
MDVGMSLNADVDLPTILIVEDDPVLQLLMVKQLTRRGFAPVGQSDGASALAWLEHSHADVIITDVMMPEMDGYEFCHHLRSRYGQNSPPVLMVSALVSRPAELAKGQSAGANDFLAKPYDLDELVSRLNGLLQL